MSLVFYAFPTFFIGLFLLKFLAIRWRVVQYPEYVSIADKGVFTWMSGLFLPGLTLALVLHGRLHPDDACLRPRDHDRGLHPHRPRQGAAPRRVLFKHTMRAVMTPLVTMAGLDLAGLLGGAIITETVFNYNGPRHDGSSGRIQKLRPAPDRRHRADVGDVHVVANIIVDCLYAVIDPRVRLADRP